MNFKIILTNVPFDLRIYLSLVANIARKHGLQVHTYADGTQVYLSFDLNNSCDEIVPRSHIESSINNNMK